MELFEAIKSRKSIRAFNPDLVSDQVLTELLEIATRAPSGVNTQPWEFFIVKGEPLKELKRAYLEEYRLGKTPNPDMPLGEMKGVAPSLKGIFRDRQVELAKGIFRIMGITKGDEKGLIEWSESMVQFYDAPTIIIVVVDKLLQGSWPVLDVGMVVQNIVLAAQAYGLGTCVMRAIVDFPEQIRKIVGVPESKRIIIGIAIGYPDTKHPINQLRTNREKIDRIVRVVE